MAKHTTPPLIRLTRASVSRGGARLLSDVTLSIAPGERLAVLGGNGAGKTTLLALLRGDISPDPSTGAPRLYHLPPGGAQPTPLGLRQRLALVSGDMQDLYARHEWAITGADAVLTGFFDTPLLYAEPTRAQRAKADEIIRALGLEELAGQRVSAMSSGQGRRILLARALACEPDALFLDECLEGLDAESRGVFLAALDRAARERPGLAILFCSHRAAELPACVDRAVALSGGRITARGPLGEVLAALDAEARKAAAAEGQAGVADQHPGVPRAAPATSATAAGGFLARITGADVTIDGRTILSGIGWTIRPGEHWAVLGENGAGKSTLLSLLAAEIWPSALLGEPGRVEYGFAPPGQTLDDTRRRIGRVSAALDRDYSVDLRVDEAVWSGAHGSIGLYAQAGPQARERAAALMEFFGVGRLAGRRIRSLSRGQLRRVMLARALAGEPALLLLDEPMAGLDARARRAARALLDKIAQAGTPLVMVTHHESDLPGQVNRVLELKDGRIVRVRQR